MRNQGIYAALACLALAGCSGLTAHDKVSDPDPALAQKAPAAQPHAAPGADPHAGLNIGNLGKPPPAAPAAPAVPPPAAEMATASHILIRYAGAVRTGPEVTRTKEEARKLAEQIDKKAKAKNADFATLANDYTEDPSGKGQGGKLGTFPKGRMVPEFDKPVFSMQPGDVSDVIETGFGFHVIKREK